MEKKSLIYQCNKLHFRPNPSSPRTFSSADKIAIGDGYPREVNGITEIMIVVKADQTNALCSATSSSRKRKRRAITVSNLEIAIPQTVLQQIMADSTM
jgi:hypothetical protein